MNLDFILTIQQNRAGTVDNMTEAMFLLVVSKNEF